MSKEILNGEELLRLAAQKFLVWASRLDERQASTVKAAQDALGIQEGTPEAMLLTGFFAGIEAGLELAGEQEGEEGCLSVPGKWGITKRPMYVTVKALNREGKEIEVRGEGLLAKALCHELDHLDGVLYTDKAIRMLSKEEIEE